MFGEIVQVLVEAESRITTGSVTLLWFLLYDVALLLNRLEMVQQEIILQSLKLSQT